MTPDKIKIKDYSATRSLAVSVWVVGVLIASACVFAGLYFMMEMRRPGGMMTMCFGGAATAYYFGKLLSEGLIIMVDNTQAAQAAVILMQSEKDGSGKSDS